MGPKSEHKIHFYVSFTPYIERLKCFVVVFMVLGMEPRALYGVKQVYHCIPSLALKVILSSIPSAPVF